MTAEESEYERLYRAITRSDEGVWAAFHLDDSAVSVFATEVEALRAAVGTSMSVVFWRFGDTLSEAQR